MNKLDVNPRISIITSDRYKGHLIQKIMITRIDGDSITREVFWSCYEIDLKFKSLKAAKQFIDNDNI